MWCDDPPEDQLISIFAACLANHDRTHSLDAFQQAKSAAVVNQDTLHPVTELAWLSGFDATMSDTSTPRAGGHQWKNRAAHFGLATMYCLIMAQWLCPISVKPLFSSYDLSSLPRLVRSIHKLHFDHFVPQMKSPTYTSSMCWGRTPLVHRITR
jgi:hypothetical protein